MLSLEVVGKLQDSFEQDQGSDGEHSDRRSGDRARLDEGHEGRYRTGPGHEDEEPQTYRATLECYQDVHDPNSSENGTLSKRLRLPPGVALTILRPSASNICFANA